MYHELFQNASFWVFLFTIDQDLAEITRMDQQKMEESEENEEAYKSANPIETPKRSRMRKITHSLPLQGQKVLACSK